MSDSNPLFFILQSKMFQLGKQCFPSPSGSSGSPLQSSVGLSSRNHSLSHSPPIGVPATWLVFIPYASTIGTYWASVLYCVTVTVLELVFSLGACLLILSFSILIPNRLGMIWRMIPFQMPHWFCIVQTVIIGLCFHILTGICGCFTWASYLTVFKPYRSIQASAS
jgi:hypothetical protein